MGMSDVTTKPQSDGPRVEEPVPAGRPRLLTVRAILVGLAGVLFVSILTPFNDYILNNTSLVGSALPGALILFFLFIVLAVNGPLRRWAPRHALGARELAVAMGMTLVSCAIPGSALMRYVPAHMVGIWAHAGERQEFGALLDAIDLPEWMFPAMEGRNAVARANDPIVREYIGRAQPDSETLLGHIRAVPWGAWVQPAITWGSFFGALFGAAICLSVLVRRQWVENERLSFPLADLCAAIIEEPSRGQAFNRTLRSRAFLIAFGLVFALHGWNALNVYWPEYWPRIPLEYNISKLATEAPLIYLDPNITISRLSFIIIGVTYFVQTRTAFSVWGAMVILQLVRMPQKFTGTYWPGPGFYDHVMGAMIPFTLMIIWIGRREWAIVLRQMTFRARPDDPRNRFLPYCVAGWGMILCCAGMFVWLMLAGASWIGSTLVVVLLMTLMLVIMRIIAQTGIPAIQFLLFVHRPWNYVFHFSPATAANPTVLKPFFLTCLMNVFVGVTQRESIGVYASHAIQLADVTDPRPPAQRRGGLGVILALCGALLVGYLVSGASVLYLEYKYTATLDEVGTVPVNAYGVGDSATYALVDAARLMQSGAPQPQAFSSGFHVFSGAAVTAVLAVLTLRFTWWPMHPIGYLLLFSWPTWRIWTSLFVGWLGKVLILRLGGAKLYQASRPFFIGLVLGECAAVGFWLIVSLLAVATGHGYKAIDILPFGG